MSLLGGPELHARSDIFAQKLWTELVCPFCDEFLRRSCDNF